ncbi:MAG TPA: hypothetical protein PKD53_30115 [Chloroflexaceae bacterium]|nr:hypothetical protein [Chloroflexaceae bacterium]
MSSLLYPAGSARGRGAAGFWLDDLALEPLVRALALSQRHAAATRGVLAELCADPATIGYRQDVLDDLLARPALAAALEALLPAVAGAATAGTSRWAGEAGLFQIAGRLAELEAYADAVSGLLAALDGADPPLAAEGWLALRAGLAEIAAGAEFQALAAELPALRARLERAGSVTLGINLDPQLRPESATLLAVNPERFGGPRSLLGRLLGGERDRRGRAAPPRPRRARPPPTPSSSAWRRSSRRWSA